MTAPVWARELEVRCRRADRRHPDACAKLPLHGTAFALPSLARRVQPQFDAAGGVEAAARSVSTMIPATTSPIAAMPNFRLLQWRNGVRS